MKALCLALLLLPCTALAQYGGSIGGGVFGAHSGGSAPSIVQSTVTGVGGAGTLVMPSPVTTGNVLIAVIYGGSGETLTFTDSLGNTGSQLAFADLTTDGDRVAVVCTTLASTGSDTLTFQANGTSFTALAAVYEATNATCTQDVTAVSSNTLAATSCTSGPMTTTTANDLLIGGCGNDGTQTGTIAAGSGWSGGLNAINPPNPPGHPVVLGEYRVATTAGSYTATSGTITSEEQGTLLVALKP